MAALLHLALEGVPIHDAKLKSPLKQSRNGRHLREVVMECITEPGALSLNCPPAVAAVMKVDTVEGKTRACIVSPGSRYGVLLVHMSNDKESCLNSVVLSAVF